MDKRSSGSHDGLKSPIVEKNSNSYMFYFYTIEKGSMEGYIFFSSLVTSSIGQSIPPTQSIKLKRTRESHDPIILLKKRYENYIF
jgi:hypothetical protein